MYKKKIIFTMMRMAEAVAETSYAVRTKVGAVIASRLTEQPVAMGYNGMPVGVENVCEYKDTDGTLISLDDVIHAEDNALRRVRSTTNWDHYSIFVTHSPCPDCAKKIVNSGIKQVFYKENYRIKTGLHHMLDNGVDVYWVNTVDEEIMRLVSAPGGIEFQATEFERGYLMDGLSADKTKLGHGILRQKMGWTCTEKKLTKKLFCDGANVIQMSRQLGRSCSSICSVLTKEGLLTYKQHTGYMASTGDHARKLWCSVECVANDRLAMDAELERLTPLIIENYRLLGAFVAIEKMNNMISPYLFMKTLEKARIVTRYNPNFGQLTHGSRAGWIDNSKGVIVYN